MILEAARSMQMDISVCCVLSTGSRTEGVVYMYMYVTAAVTFT